MSLLQLPEVSKQALAHSGGIGEQVFILDDAHVLEGRCRSRGAAAEGRDVTKIGKRISRVVLEQVKYRLGGDRTRDGGVPGGDTLGHGHEVWLDAVMLVAEPFAGSAHATDHLVDVQQNAMATTDLLHALPVSGRRGDHAAAGGHRFQADRPDRVGPFALDDLLDGIGRALAVVGYWAILAAVLQAMRNFDEAGGRGTVLSAALGLAAGR